MLYNIGLHLQSRLEPYSRLWHISIEMIASTLQGLKLVYIGHISIAMNATTFFFTAAASSKKLYRTIGRLLSP